MKKVDVSEVDRIKYRVYKIETSSYNEALVRSETHVWNNETLKWNYLPLRYDNTELLRGETLCTFSDNSSFIPEVIFFYHLHFYDVLYFLIFYCHIFLYFFLVFIIFLGPPSR